MVDRIARARIESALLAELVELLERQVRDPRVEGVTLTGVEVARDLAVAKVFFSTLGDAEAHRVAQRGLDHAAAFLRREAGRRLRLRQSPELRFHFDASLETGQRIETLLREWHDEDKPAAPEPREGET